MTRRSSKLVALAIVVVSGRARADEPTTEVDREALFDVPNAGHLFDDRLGLVPGAQYDGLGTGISGGTALENRYLIDGLDVTELRFGRVGAVLPVELIDTIRIVGGGYGPDLGRATGGIVDVTTRHGTNELHGSVFAMVAPGFLTAPVSRLPPSTIYAPITASSSPAYDVHAGFELGGPIVRDHVWFYVGFAPTLDATTITRTTQRQTDCTKLLPGGQLSSCQSQFGDGIPDTDPRTGAPIVDVLDQTELTSTQQTYTTLARLDVAASPAERGMVSLLATPRTTTSPAVFGVASSGRATSELTTDATARWTSRLGDALELTAQLGWHHASYEDGAYDPSQRDQPQSIHENGAPFTQLGGESAATIAGCTDGAGDPYPQIANCPAVNLPYTTGGPGLLERDRQDRFGARVAATSRFTAAGSHALSLGLDTETSRLSQASAYSGGQQIIDGTVELVQVQLAPIRSTDPRFDLQCSDGSLQYRCAIIDGFSPTITQETTDWSAFVRDVWQPRDDLAIDLGVRYDTQHLSYGSDLQSATDPITSPPYGDTHLTLGRIEPRVGVSFDPTGEGRGQVFARWGRYAESVPMDVNARALSDGPLIGVQAQLGDITLRLPATPTAIAPGIRGEYLDELVVGARYELAEGFVVGATFRDRRLHEVVEDLFDGSRLVIGNPGETPSTVPYERPTRDYDAIELTIAHRFARRLYLQASYTYARTFGDYAGGVDYDTGQVDPNILLQYDQGANNANRRGVLPQDRPHSFKLDAAYTLPVGSRSALVLGARFRALSGTPLATISGTGADATDVLLLPRGAVGRTSTVADLDLHVAVRRALGRGTALELFCDVFDVLDDQAAFAVDAIYAPAFTRDSRPQSAAPVSGGSYGDLIWVKSFDLSGQETSQPIGRNPNFGHATASFPPLVTQLGARLTF